MRLLTSADVRHLLPMPVAITCMREAFAQLSSGAATVPVRTRLDAPETGCRTLFMPAYLPHTQHLGLKTVTIQGANAARGLPTIHGLMLVIDATTGQPTALMDAEALTAIRTGAASGLATDLLALPDASTVALFGAGAQARTQLEAVCAVRPITDVVLFSRSPERAEAFAQTMSDALDIPIRLGSDLEQLRDAAIICTATTSSTPLFDAAHVAPGTHLNGIGSYRPDMAEIPAGLVRSSILIVDHRASCLAEAGDILQAFGSAEEAAAHIQAEIGEIVLGHKMLAHKKTRTASTDVTVFKSVGNAVQDAVAAHYVVQRAAETGHGQVVRL